MKVYNGTAFVTSAGFASFATTDMTDVAVASIADNDILAWNSGTSKWTNQTPAEASIDVSDLADTTITSVADNEVLAYDNSSSKWINQTAAEAGLITSIPPLAVTGLSDATITSVADNEVLAYDNGSSTWINQTAGEANLALANHDHTGTYEPASAAIQTHVANTTNHRAINDSATGTTDLWSADKIGTVTAANTSSISTNTTAIAAIADPVVMAIALG